MRSPICIALVAGLLVSPFRLNPEWLWLAPFFQAAHMVGKSIALLACLILAIQLKLRSVKGMGFLVLIPAVIQLGLHPWLANVQANLYHFALESRRCWSWKPPCPRPFWAWSSPPVTAAPRR